VSWLLAAGKSCKQAGDYVGMTEQMVQRVYGHPDEDVQRATANAIRNISRTAHEMPTKYPVRA
jgi:predicted GIY-YIG superfamily endonuclease